MTWPRAALTIACALWACACSRSTAPEPRPAPERAAPSQPPAQPSIPDKQGAQTPSQPGPAANKSSGPQASAPALLPARCAQPFESGPCKAAFSVYWFDASTGRCEPRIYGGCGGNDNRFEDLESCEAACLRPQK